MTKGGATEYTRGRTGHMGSDAHTKMGSHAYIACQEYPLHSCKRSPYKTPLFLSAIIRRPATRTGRAIIHVAQNERETPAPRLMWSRGIMGSHRSMDDHEDVPLTEDEETILIHLQAMTAPAE